MSRLINVRNISSREVTQLYFHALSRVSCKNFQHNNSIEQMLFLLPPISVDKWPAIWTKIFTCRLVDPGYLLWFNYFLLKTPASQCWRKISAVVRGWNPISTELRQLAYPRDRCQLQAKVRVLKRLILTNFDSRMESETSDDVCPAKLPHSSAPRSVSFDWQ